MEHGLGQKRYERIGILSNHWGRIRQRLDQAVATDRELRAAARSPGKPAR